MQNNICISILILKFRYESSYTNCHNLFVIRFRGRIIIYHLLVTNILTQSTYTHTHTHTHTLTHTQKHTYAHTLIYTATHFNTHIHTCMHVHHTHMQFEYNSILSLMSCTSDIDIDITCMHIMVYPLHCYEFILNLCLVRMYSMYTCTNVFYVRMQTKQIFRNGQ